MRAERRLLAPEVIQTSAMDCGPAALRCLLEGFGISASYGRLREACQTDVDGTSIDTMEELAQQLGLEAEQRMLPADHILIHDSHALPAIVVTRLPNGATHFVVAWRRHGPWVQLMDAATGRRWWSCRRFVEQLYTHRHAVAAAEWRRWAATEAFLRPLRYRLKSLGLSAGRISESIDEAHAEPDWRPLATLDAATRMVESLAQSGGLRRGRQASAALCALLQRTRQESAPQLAAIPPCFWSVHPAARMEDGVEQVLLQGAVLVTIRGRRGEATASLKGADGESTAAPAALSPELAAALKEPPSRPFHELLRLLRADGLLSPVALGGALFLAAGAVLLEALLFRGLLDLADELHLVGQRLTAISAVLLFLSATLLLELCAQRGLLRLGRQVECRLRLRFLEKIPRLGDRYFRSRLASDMAERSHGIHRVRLLGQLSGNLLRLIFELLLTTAGIIWLDPRSAPLALLAGAAALGVPLLALPVLAEQDLRLRTHGGALSRFSLDVLLGLIPVRGHSAERPVRREHESLLVEWTRTGRRLIDSRLGLHGLQLLTGFGLAAWILVVYLQRNPESGAVLLLVYWVLNLPYLGEQITLLLRQYPEQRNLTLRLLEPLGAPETDSGLALETAPQPSPEAGESPGASIRFEGVTVVATGHTILREVDLDIVPGSDVAVVGPSGAGKSSLVGLLLGYHRPARGRLLVDGLDLEAETLDSLRRATAWVDPSVQLWNRTLVENLRYGNPQSDAFDLEPVLDAADLRAVLHKLPEGLRTELGQGGALVSGGEGQRVRLGRALLKPGVRLVILDEPFRGLERQQRETLLQRCRGWWRDATLIVITHDIGATLSFDQVVLLEAGRVVEKGPPRSLAAQAGSRYEELLSAEEAIRERLTAGTEWRRLWLDAGVVEERCPS